MINFYLRSFEAWLKICKISFAGDRRGSEGDSEVQRGHQVRDDYSGRAASRGVQTQEDVALSQRNHP